MSDTHFDEIAGAYDESLPRHVVEHYLQKRSSFIGSLVPTGSSILDVGCGTGALAVQVEAAGYSVAGIDPSEGMLEVLKERAPSIDVTVGSGTDIPFEKDHFDLTYCVAVMHHIATEGDVRRTLSEMVRVTKPDGRVLIWDHNPRNPYWRSLMARVPQDTGEERLIPEQEILEGLRGAGATPISSQQLGLVPDFIPPSLIPLAARTERLAERLPGVRRLCAHNVVLAAKGTHLEPSALTST